MPHIQNMAHDPIFPVKKLVNLTDEQSKLINDFRYDHRLPSDNEAIRLLIDRGLASNPTPASASPPAGEPAPVIEPPSGALPAPRSRPPVDPSLAAETYAPASVYQILPIPPEGYSWEECGGDEAYNVRVSRRLAEKIRWLVKQFMARDHSTSKQKMTGDVLQVFVRRELPLWGVPPEHLD
jgi:hypothetical protein